MRGDFYKQLNSDLDTARAEGLFKEERIITSAQQADITVADGSHVINFCAYNYLGLANHPELIAAAKAGMKMALIPSANSNDVLVAKKYYSTMDIYTVTTFRDVVEYAFIDCPKKTEYLDKLSLLNPDGKSLAKKIDAPKDYVVKEVRAESVEVPKPEPVLETVVIEKRKADPDAVRMAE